MPACPGVAGLARRDTQMSLPPARRRGEVELAQNRGERRVLVVGHGSEIDAQTGVRSAAVTRNRPSPAPSPMRPRRRRRRRARRSRVVRTGAGLARWRAAAIAPEGGVGPAGGFSRVAASDSITRPHRRQHRAAGRWDDQDPGAGRSCRRPPRAPWQQIVGGGVADVGCRFRRSAGGRTHAPRHWELRHYPLTWRAIPRVKIPIASYDGQKRTVSGHDR